MFELRTKAQRERAVQEQMQLHDALWEVVERHCERWQDQQMDDRMIGAIILSVATTFAGDALAMVANVLGMHQEALETGAEILRKGALTTASVTIEMLKDSEEPDGDNTSDVRH